MNKPTIIDLYSGCGGLALGSEMAGFRSIAAVDIDPTLQSSYQKNFPRTAVINGSVAEIDLRDWSCILGKERPDGIVGGPPCQGFSNMGKRDINDPRNTLIHHFYRQVEELRPRFFLMENVEGLLRSENVGILNAELSRISKHYEIVGPLVVNAADFGAPTNRFRVVVVGYDKNEMSPILPSDFQAQKKIKYTTVMQAISDLPQPTGSAVNNKDYDWIKYPSGTQFGLSKYAKLQRTLPPQGLGCDKAVEMLKHGYVSGLMPTVHSDKVARRYRETLNGKTDKITKSYKLDWDGQCPTLRAGTGSDKGSFQAVRPLHPSEGRVITVREAARLQGFPDWFLFHPTKWHSFRMIGNSVSPVVSYEIMQLIRTKIGLSLAA